MPGFEVTDLYSLLQNIRIRPEMYIRGKALSEIEQACHWYCAALLTHKVEEFGTSFNEKLRGYLWYRFKWGTACGWARAIRDRAANDDEAFDRFFVLLEEYKASGFVPEEVEEELFVENHPSPGSL